MRPDLKPGQITLADAQVERGNARQENFEIAPDGETVDVLRVPEGMGTFSDARSAVRGVQAARQAAGLPQQVRRVMPPPVYQPADYSPPVLTPRELMARLREEGK